MSRSNETRHLKWYDTCKFKCSLPGSVCNNEKRQNKDKCRCESRKLIKKGKCDTWFIWNPSNCECECDFDYNDL